MIKTDAKNVQPIRLGVFEDQKIICDSLKNLLIRRHKVEPVLLTSSPSELFSFIQSSPPDILLVNLAMPHFMGYQCVFLLVEHYPQLHIIVRSHNTFPELLPELVKAGVHVCLPSHCGIREFLDYVTELKNNPAFINSEFAPVILEEVKAKVPPSQTPVNTAKNKPKKELSETNIIILKLLCQGKSAKKIAEIVHKSESTVYKQIESLKEYFEVNSKAGLIIAAERMGLAG